MSYHGHLLSGTYLILILKYEDLVYDKLNTVNKIVDFFKKNYNLNLII